MAKKSHDLLLLGAAGVAGFFAYEKWVKPGMAAAATTDPLTGLPLTPAYTPSNLTYSPGTGGGVSTPTAPYVTAPTSLVPTGPQPSNLNPGAVVGGPTGTCMSRKGWPQAQCQQRLDALTSAYQSAAQTLASLQNGAGLAQQQQLLAANQAAIAQAIPVYNAALARGDQGTANQWKIAIDGHNADIANIQAAINGVGAKTVAIQNEIAGLKSDYLALTGLTLA